MEVIQIAGGDILMTNSLSFITLWPWKIGQGHPSLNLTLSFILWNTGIYIEVSLVQIVGWRIR